MPITRRTLVQAATSGVLSVPFIRPSHAAERTVTLLTYSGVYQDSFQETVIDPFMRTHPGIKVSYYGVPSSAQMLGLLRVQKAAPQTDVTIFELTFSKTATDEDLVDPLTRNSMPVMAELDDTSFVPGVGGATIAYDSLALLYAPETIKPAPTSWKELWNKQHGGRITIPGLPDLTGACMVIIANYMAGADYRQSTAKGFEAMAEMAPLVLSWEPKPDSYSFVVNGVADLGVGWNARAQLFAKQNPARIKAIMPTEGSLVYHNTINLTKNAPQTDAAKEFVAYALSAEAQKAFAERLFYTPSNTKVVLDAETLQRMPAIGDAGRAKLFKIDWIEVAKMRDRMNGEWRRRVLTRG